MMLKSVYQFSLAKLKIHLKVRFEVMEGSKTNMAAHLHLMSKMEFPPVK